METFVLMALAHGNRWPEYIEEYIAMELPTVGPPITSPDMMLLLLIKLREKKLVSEADKPSDSGLSEWNLLESRNAASDLARAYLISIRVGTSIPIDWCWASFGMAFLK